MRLWTLHPKYLDARGLVALWRESLLAKRVLQGRTRGYRQHPQLERFRSSADPVAAIDDYLSSVCDEADRRGYRFDRRKVGRRGTSRRRMTETRGQLQHEWRHLLSKLKVRAPEQHRALADVSTPDAHPSFRVVDGGVPDWERAGVGFTLEGIDHIALAVRDVPASARWFEDVLGLTRRYQDAWGDYPAVVGVGTTSLALFPVETDDPLPRPGRNTLAMRHLAFRADRAGFRAAQRSLTRRRIPFTFQDHAISHSIYFLDPNGHEIEITTYDLLK